MYLVEVNSDSSLPILVEIYMKTSVTWLPHRTILLVVLTVVGDLLVVLDRL